MRGMMSSFRAAGHLGPPVDLGGHDSASRRLTGEDDMDARDLFLDPHAAMHAAVVGVNRRSAAERTSAGLTDEQMPVRPREDLNSLAWLMWHIARAEDVFVNALLAAGPQILDETWKKRLGVDRPDFGIGMTSPEVTHLPAPLHLR